MRPVDRNWPAADLEAVDTCPVCGEPGRTLFFDGLTDDIFEAAPGKWTLYRCSHCASGYLDPRPDPSSIGRAYEDYYTHTSIEHAVVRRRGLLGTWLHDLINGYQNRRYGFQRLPSRPLGRWLIPLMPPLRAAADSEARQLPGMSNERRLLDVGCGNGDFMDLASRSGWNVEGLDFDAKAVKVVRSRGMVAHLGGIESLAHRDALYDVITLSHVIEHAHHPLELLRHAYDMLRPGGSCGSKPRIWIALARVASGGIGVASSLRGTSFFLTGPVFLRSWPKPGSRHPGSIGGVLRFSMYSPRARLPPAVILSDQRAMRAGPRPMRFGANYARCCRLQAVNS